MNRSPIWMRSCETEMRVELSAFTQGTDATIVYVDHDQIGGHDAGARIAVMRAGRIEQYARARRSV